jgi:Ca2+-binding RTX toxin-like protein
MNLRSAGVNRSHAFLLVGLALCALAVPAVPLADTNQPPPVIERSSPASGSNDKTPMLRGAIGSFTTTPDGIRGFATGGITVEIFLALKDCRGLIPPRWFGTAGDFVTWGVEVSVPDDSITTFYARARYPEGVTGCSGGFEYKEISTPTITDAEPDSVSNDNSPLLKGVASPGTDTVEIFADLDDCLSDSSLRLTGYGHASQFTSTGIEVSVFDDTVTTFYAHGLNAEGRSACSPGFTYQELSTPVITASDPESPANNNSPRLKGVAAGSDLIEIFDNLEACRANGSPRWYGTAAEFTTSGIQVSVADDTITTFYARGVFGGPPTGCSTGFIYEERALPAAPSKRKDCFGTATILGTDGDDVLVGTAGDDRINGLGGNDVIRGMEGADQICGGLGNDEIYGGPGDDRLVGDFLANNETPGNDTIYGEDGDDIILGDVVDAGPLAVSGGSDVIDGGNGADFIKGDSLGFTSGADERYGGDDTIFGGSGADFVAGDGLEGGAGADRLVGGDDTLHGGEGKDRLRGDELAAGAGSDEVVGGYDYIYGGGGDDSIRGDDFDSTDDDASDVLTGGPDVLSGEAGNDSIEGDAIVGGPGDDTLNGGQDALYGGSGVDALFGDRIWGDAGSDTATLATDVLQGGVGNDQLFGDDTAGVETNLFGDDILFGDSDNDFLYCQDGVDRADGGAGVDTQQSCEVALGIP